MTSSNLSVRQGARRPKRGRLSRDAGDTLIEVLLALVVFGIATTALFSALTASVQSSVTHRSQASLQALLGTYAGTATSQIEFSAKPLYTSCATPQSYRVRLNLTEYNRQLAVLNAALVDPYIVELTKIQFWNGTSYSNSCQKGSQLPQLITVLAVGPHHAKASSVFSVQNLAYNGPVPVAVAQTPAAPASVTATKGQLKIISIPFTGTPAPVLTCFDDPPTNSVPCSSKNDDRISFVDNGKGTGFLVVSSLATANPGVSFTIRGTNGYPDPTVPGPSVTIKVVVQ